MPAREVSRSVRKLHAWSYKCVTLPQLPTPRNWAIPCFPPPLPAPRCSGFKYKHNKPLSADIVRFTPYAESEDDCRGTTVLPYLEAFYQYGTDDGLARGPNVVVSGASPPLEGSQNPSPRNVIQEGNWISEDDLFGDATSVHSSERDRSLENITQRKSRVSSSEDGKVKGHQSKCVYM